MSSKTIISPHHFPFLQVKNTNCPLPSWAEGKHIFLQKYYRPLGKSTEMRTQGQPRNTRRGKLLFGDVSSFGLSDGDHGVKWKFEDIRIDWRQAQHSMKTIRFIWCWHHWIANENHLSTALKAKYDRHAETRRVRWRIYALFAIVRSVDEIVFSRTHFCNTLLVTTDDDIALQLSSAPVSNLRDIHILRKMLRRNSCAL